MSAVRLDGKEVSQKIKHTLKERVDILKAKGIPCGLAVVLVGENPASKMYVSFKAKDCEEVGIESRVMIFPEDASGEELLDTIDKLNNDPAITGILIQLPLPSHLDENEIILAVDPAKDADGLHPVNLGKLVLGEKGPVPCTPAGCIRIMREYGIDIAGSDVVIVGRSSIVGKPLANLLLQKGSEGNATVTVCHSATSDLAEKTSKADILIAAIGKPDFITGDMVKDGAVVIDVGINRVPDETRKRGYRVTGDVDFVSVDPVASYITPVPGGIGPMTRAMLLHNTVKASEWLSENE